VHILYENQNIPKELEKYIIENEALHPYFDINFKGVKPKNYCGFLSINNESYFIAPKIATDDTQNLNIFLYMFIYAYDIELKNEDFIQGGMEKSHILDIFIKLFAYSLLEELKRGVFKKYITLQDNLKVLRGKYIVEKNFSNFYHQNVYCEFDEFSMDNELNRFFLYALSYFKRFSNYPNLYRCEVILDEVNFFNLDFKKLNIDFDRMNSRYKKSYEIALMILQKLVPIVNSSSSKSFAFLFNMAEVFEKFIGKIYKEIDSTTHLQCEKNYGSLKLKPDIATSKIIIDTKYKKLSKRNNLDRNDKYQMFVYGINFDIRDTMLLYPKHLVNIDDNLELGKEENLVRLKLKSLDLNLNCGYNGFIKNMKWRVKKL
jgi:5-methylcytosine-specific restriction enzyme subunit McrC